MPQGPLDFFIGDVVRLRKPHPCGSFAWTVVRLGADIGLRCHGCDHKVLLPRRTVEKRLKTFVSRGPAYAEALALQARAGAGETAGTAAGNEPAASRGDR
jgi:hypothetical protein